LLPDDPHSKVNACVGNIYRIWDEGQDKKLTQLVFCDISTPKSSAEKAAKVAAKAEPAFINGVQVPGTGEEAGLIPEKTGKMNSAYMKTSVRS
jgi:hypothetical protein